MLKSSERIVGQMETGNFATSFSSVFVGEFNNSRGDNRKLPSVGSSKKGVTCHYIGSP